MRAGMGARRASAVPALHLGLDRQAQGRAALDRRLPAARGADDEVDLRPEARRHLLVHRRHRLGHRPHLHRLRAARARRHRDRLRGHPDLPRRRPLLADDRQAQGLDLLHRADGDPRPDQDRRGQRQGAPEELRPVEPAHPRLGRRADQPGRLGVVPQARRRRPLPDRRHLLADRDRRPRDHAAARARRRSCPARARCRSPASTPRSSTSRATTCRTARAASWSSRSRGRA